MVAFKMTFLDKSCCLGYNCIEWCVANQQESWVEKYGWFGKNHIWYILASIIMITFIIDLPRKSCCLGYNHVDTFVGNQREGCVGNFWWFLKNLIL